MKRRKASFFSLAPPKFSKLNKLRHVENNNNNGGGE
jgi:hypothetical protein